MGQARHRSRPVQYSHNICCDPDGWVYVADRENHRVQVFDGNGKFETQWNNLHRPNGMYMAAGRDALFYIGEGGSSGEINKDWPNIGPRVSLHTSKGMVLARLGKMHIGLAPGQLTSPHGIAVDGHGQRGSGGKGASVAKRNIVVERNS
jgi:DNA-binding beta-propeller fold protein YncE